MITCSSNEHDQDFDGSHFVWVVRSEGSKAHLWQMPFVGKYVILPANLWMDSPEIFLKILEVFWWFFGDILVQDTENSALHYGCVC